MINYTCWSSGGTGGKGENMDKGKLVSTVVKSLKKTQKIVALRKNSFIYPVVDEKGKWEYVIFYVAK